MSSAAPHPLLVAARSAAAAGHTQEAMTLVGQLLADQPHHLAAAQLFAHLSTRAGDPAAASAWQRVLALSPDDPEAHFQLGNAAGDRGDFATAAAHLEAALRRAPGHPALLNNLALAYEGAGRLDEAVACLRNAAPVAPDPLVVHESLARTLFSARRYAEALPELETLLQARNDDPMLLAARAVCLADAGRDAEAEAAYRRSLALDSTHPRVALDFARFLLARRRYDDADPWLTALHAQHHDDALALSLLLTCRRERADLADEPRLRAALIATVSASDWTGWAAAYDFVAACGDPLLQRRVAERYAAAEGAPVSASEGRTVPAAPASRDAALRSRAVVGERSRRLRLGFVSSDLREHPVARLAAPLFSHLDASRVEVSLYDTGESSAPGLPMPSTARHVRLPRRDVFAAVQALRGDDLDVLVDLNGFSGGEALAVFARRPAPVQVNFLGYTGTLGSTVYDAIVADGYCIPDATRDAYVETPVLLAPCYLPFAARPALPHVPRRNDYGLQDATCVLYAQVARYKVGAALFDAWMAVLEGVPGSVLWLRAAPDDVQARLRAVATQAGVAAARLVFAPTEALDRYLARMPLADVMLDTAPFGSHTTVHDAVTMGLPAITLAGDSFAARASASQLLAAGVPELVVASLDAYVRQAIALGRDAALRADLRQRLLAAQEGPLFDIAAYAARFTQAMEGLAHAH